MSPRISTAAVSRTETPAPDASGVRAALAGGARKRGWSCAALITLSLSALSLTCGPSLAAEEPVDLGTGKVFDFHDMIDEAPTYRFRFVQPALGQEGMTYVDLADDLALLCAGFALPKLSESGLAPERVVISLMSAPTEFGVRNPEITQFFESFLVENDLCIWEAF